MKKWSLRMHLPNIITLTNLTIGCIAVMNGWTGHYVRAAGLVLFCVFLDFFDGFAARALKASSDLGEELDTLTDLVSFGVAPAAIATGLMQSEATKMGWNIEGFMGAMIIAVPMFLPVFSAIRLSLFNLDRSKSTHFNGMPVPADAVAFAALAFIYADTRFTAIKPLLLHPYVVMTLIVLNSWLMVAPVAMFSFKLKNYSISSNKWRYIYVLVTSLLVVVFRGYGLFAAFILYIIASLLMTCRLRREANH